MQLLLVGFVVYFFVVGMIALASYLHYRSSTSSDYGQVIIGNRSVNYFLTALSAHASDMSEWLFMSVPALLYTGGVTNAWIAIGLVCGMWFTWQFIAPGLRRKTEEYDCYTLSTFFDRRFKDSSGFLRIMSAAISLFFFAVYIAAGLKAFGMLAESLFHLPYIVGTLVAMLFMVTYIILGGYRALSWIDCFQALFLLIVILAVPLVGLMDIGGWQAVVHAANNKQLSLSLFPGTLIENINVILLAFSWGLGYFGLPHLLTKFMGIADVKDITKAKYIGLAWQTTVLAAAILVGLVGIVSFPMIANPELLFIEMVKNSFSVLLSGFILSAVAGATISVITAQMLVLVSVITEDFYRNTLCPQATEKSLLWVYRLSILVVAVFSFTISIVYKSSSIQNLVSYAWMGFASSFAPLVLLSLHSKIINKYGAYASLVIGGLTAALWPSLSRSFYGVIIPPAAAGFILSIVGAYGISWATRKT